MKKTLIDGIIENNSKIAIMIDECTAINQASTLIIYIRTCATTTSEKVNLFVGLIDLKVSYQIFLKLLFYKYYRRIVHNTKAKNLNS